MPCALASRRCVLVGVAGGRSGGDALRRCGGRLRSGAVPPPAVRLQSGLSGSPTHVLWARICGPGGQALSLWLACPAGSCVPRGWWEAVPGGAGLPPLWGSVRRCPSPGRPSLGAGSQGSATCVSWARSVQAWGPGTGPSACALASGCCALCGWREGVPGGGALRRCEGRLSSGAPPLPAARPQGGLWGSATDVLWTRMCGRGGPALSVWLACPAGGCVPRGWREAIPGGGHLPPLSGASGVRRCPSPGCPSLGAGSQGSATRVFRARLVWAWGSSTGPTARALANRRCALWGWREGVPAGGALRRCERRLSSGALPFPAARPQGELSGSLHTCCGRGCAGVGAHHCLFGLHALPGAA